MLRRTPLRFTAVALTALVAGAAASPALAATQVAKGTATAANISIAGMGTDTGTYTASNDGKSETTSGTNTPAIPLLNGQQVVSAGTFAQDAKTTVKDGAVGTKACAGFAGQGATLAAVGDGNCLIGGQTLNLSAGAFDFSNLDLGGGGTLSEMLPADTLGPLKGALRPGQLTKLTDALSSGFQQVSTALGNPAVNLNFDALQASCTAAPGSADGTADLGMSGLDVSLPALPGAASQKINLVNFEANPKPNTPISATPSVLLNALTDSLKSSLTQNFNGLPAPIATILKTLGGGLDQTSVINDAVAMASDQFGPQLNQLISGTLNKQSRPDNDSIDVTALDLNILPAAAAATGGSALASLQVGAVTCDAGTFKPAAATTPTPTKKSDVPTAIDSGLAGDGGSSPVLPVVGGLMLLAGAGIGVRRVLHTRG